MNCFKARTISILLLLFISASIQAQQKIDSLKNVVDRLLDDTIKTNTLILLSEELYRGGQSEESRPYIKKALIISRLQKYSKGEGNALLVFGHILLSQSKFDSALNYFHDAQNCFGKVNNAKGQIRSFTYIGQTYDILSKYDSAIINFRKALSLEESQKMKDNESLSKILNSIGVTYFNKGSYELAIDNYFKALALAEGLKNKRLLGVVHNNLGAVNVRIENYPQALSNFLKLLELARELENQPAIALALSNASECLTQLADYSKAEKFLNEAITIRKKLNDKRGIIYTLCNIADLGRKRGNLQEARNQYQKALDLARPFNESELLLNPLTGIAEVNIELKKINEANAQLAESRTIARHIGSKLWIEKLYRISSQLDSVRGDFRGAYSWYKKYSSLHDSLFNERKSMQIEEMKALYESEKKDKEIQLLNEVKKREELKYRSDEKLYITFAIVFSILLISMVYWLLTKIRTEHILKRQKKEVSDANDEMRLLIQKIEEQNDTLAIKNDKLEDLHREKDGMIGIVAHDLRSPLNRVAGLAELISLTGETNEEQKSMISRIRKVCEDGNGLIRDLMELHQIEDETSSSSVSTFEMKSMLKSWTENYSVQLQKKNLHLETDLESEEPLEVTCDLFCVTRVLDNLLTNAIKFSPFNKNIYLQLRSDKDHIQIKIKDEGQGFQPQDMPHLFKKFKKLSARPTAGEHSTGLGLSIVKALLEKLKGKIEVQSFPGEGATFLITLPLEKESLAVF